MQTTVNVAKATQTAVPEIGMAEKVLYYLIIGEGEKKVQVNVGQKTYENVAKVIGKEIEKKVTSNELKEKVEANKKP